MKVSLSLSAVFCFGAAHQLYSQVEVVLIKDVNTGEPDAFSGFTFTDAVVSDDLLYFKANDGVHGEELWTSDGTMAGTNLLKDINPGTGTVSPNSFTPFNGLIYFQADDGVHGRELWVTDGTEAGTALFMDINPGEGHGSPLYFTQLNGLLYFSANNGMNGQELWVTDGTVDGTFMLKDIRPGFSSSSSSPILFTEYNGKLYFRANDGVHGDEVWVTDGTADGTLMLKDIYEGNQNSSSDPLHFTVFNNELYFIANDGIHGYELWKTNGIEAGTQLVKDVNPGPVGIVFGNFIASPAPKVFNGKLYFGGIEEDPVYYLWQTDGTEAGTQKFTLPDETGLMWPREFTLFDGMMYFVASDNTTNDELWRTDGSAAGTALVKDINPGAESSQPRHLTPYNFKLYFTASDGSNGAELWHTDGTEEGTVKIAPAFATQSDPLSMGWNQFREVGGRLLFPARYESLGSELYAVVDATVGASQHDDAAAFNLYPNPVTETLHVDFESLTATVELMVYSSLGQLMMSRSVHTSEPLRIDVSDLAPGVYVLSLQSEAGRHAKRFLKR